jgi:riboflavin-specific deaminase-like protein
MTRPRVVVNMAMTVDGKIASAKREYPHLTSRLDRSRMDRLRAAADAIVVGAGTVRAIDPPLHVRDPSLRKSRPPPAHVVVSASGEVNPSSRALSNPSARARVLATTEGARVPVGNHVEVWRLGERQVDLRLLLERLAGRGFEKVLVEGGALLNWSLVEHDLLDELYVTIAPAILGGRSAPTLVDGAGLPMADRIELRLLSAEAVGDELFCHYQRAGEKHPRGKHA